MRFLILVTTLIAPALGAAPSAAAQSIPADSGQPVRVALRAGPLIEGILVRQTPEQLDIRVAAGDSGAHAMFLVRDVESVATPTYVRSAGSALTGLVVGLGVGAILGGVIARTNTSCNDMCGMNMLAVPAFGLLGGFVGLMAGSSRTTTEWIPIWPVKPPTP